MANDSMNNRSLFPFIRGRILKHTRRSRQEGLPPTQILSQLSGNQRRKRTLTPSSSTRTLMPRRPRAMPRCTFPRTERAVEVTFALSLPGIKHRESSPRLPHPVRPVSDPHYRIKGRLRDIILITDDDNVRNSDITAVVVLAIPLTPLSNKVY